MASQRLITGMVRARGEAEDVVRRILDSGHTRRDVCAIVSEATRRQHILRSRAYGAASHGSALTSVLAAASAGLVVPGLRLAVAGPIAVRLADASSASETASLSSVLVDAGIPEQSAPEVERRLKEGAMLLGALARDEKDAAALRAILRDPGSGDFCGTGQGARVFASL
ncbi:hypothetical protein WME95_06920 [Sorangium sp. So ce327]|jgi:hypothetical protein|uniref:hypothetical protein n=1 Tax=unclassified Sorangium TaxID=2621164 RepID=UPI003F604FBB